MRFMTYSGLSIITGFTVLALMLGLKKPVWLALLSASLAMGLIGAGPPDLAKIMLSTVSSSSALDLLVITFLIAVLVNLYRVSGFLARLGEELVKFLKKPRLITMFVPAIMGLLPVAGGALMSVPVVDTVGNHLKISKKLRLFINVWFRHVIFMVYPLSTVIITTAALAGVNMWHVILRELPVALSMIIVGYILGFRGYRPHSVDYFSVADPGTLARVFSPILVAVATSVATGSLLDKQILPSIPLTRYSMILGLILAIVFLARLSKMNLKGIREAVLSKSVIELTVAAFSAILLRDIFVAVKGPEIFSTFFSPRNEAGRTALLILIPFTMSLATGSPLTGSIVAISVLQHTLNIGLKEVSLIYASNMLGYLASPAHLCYVYTAQYFELPLTSAYPEMFTAVAVTLVTAIGVYFVMP